MKKIIGSFFLAILATQFILCQTNSLDSILQKANLNDCVQYALKHQPVLRQSSIDEQITERQINSKLADWYPQLNLNYSLQHYYQLPVGIVQGQPVKQGVFNNSSVDLSLTQNIFNKDVLLASSTAGDVRKQSLELTTANKIDVVVNVSKAFYAVLLAKAQINLVQEDILRLGQSEKDTKAQLSAGVVDKTDYERATIALNNAKAELRQDEELLNTRTAQLKDAMGFPTDKDLELSFDSSQMISEAFIDTNQTLNYENRIEYKLLQTQQRLLKANQRYYEWSFIPSLSAFAGYNLSYQNNIFKNLYNQNFPNSFIGLELSFPIFQGGKRIQEIQEASLEVKRSDYDFATLKSSITVEYTSAMANYKSNLNNFNIMKENLTLAKDVYNTIELQYKAGVKTYLDLITAETDLRTTEVNYLNSLYLVLSSKIDVEKALGIIRY